MGAMPSPAPASYLEAVAAVPGHQNARGCPCRISLGAKSNGRGATVLGSRLFEPACLQTSLGGVSPRATIDRGHGTSNGPVSHGLRQQNCQGPRGRRLSLGHKGRRRQVAQRPPVHATSAGSTSAGEFFQSDVVEYGSRYNRPDRFPRLKQADRSRRAVDVTQWLLGLCHVAHELGFQGVALPQCDEAVHCKAGAGMSRELMLLAKQGRLEEALRLVEQWELKDKGAEGGDKQETDHAEVLHHSSVLLAAVDAGDIALAFEYAGLLPPKIDYYNLLMSVYAIRADLDAVLLGLNTAKRRGLEPNATSILLGATAAVLVQDWERADSFLVEAKEAGLCTNFLTAADLAAKVESV